MDWWHPAIKAALSERNRFIMLDHRGTGRSDAPTEAYSISDMAKDVVGLMNALDIDKAHILGQSMGGMIAQELAIEYPQSRGKISLMLHDLRGQTGSTFFADDKMADTKKHCFFSARHTKYALLQSLYSRESSHDRFTCGTDADRAFES